MKMRRFFDSANALLRMTYLEVRRKLTDKQEFSSSNDTEQDRMGNDNFRTVHELAGGTAAR